MTANCKTDLDIVANWMQWAKWWVCQADSETEQGAKALNSPHECAHKDTYDMVQSYLMLWLAGSPVWCACAPSPGRTGCLCWPCLGTGHAPPWGAPGIRWSATVTFYNGYLGPFPVEQHKEDYEGSIHLWHPFQHAVKTIWLIRGLGKGCFFLKLTVYNSVTTCALISSILVVPQQTLMPAWPTLCQYYNIPAWL